MDGRPHYPPSRGSFFSGCHSCVHLHDSGLQPLCARLVAIAAAYVVCKNYDGGDGLHNNHIPVELPLWQQEASAAAAAVCYR